MGAKKTAKKKEDKAGEWGGKRKGSGRKVEVKEATTKSVVLDAASLKVVERYIKRNTTKDEEGNLKPPGFSEAVRAILTGKAA